MSTFYSLANQEDLVTGYRLLHPDDFTRLFPSWRTVAEDFARYMLARNLPFVIHSAGSPAVILWLHDFDDKKCWISFFSTGKGHKGRVFQAAATLLEEVFEQSSLEVISAEICRDNPASVRIAEKLGFYKFCECADLVYYHKKRKDKQNG